jgi:hypothetical protein
MQTQREDYGRHSKVSYKLRRKALEEIHPADILDLRPSELQES